MIVPKRRIEFGWPGDGGVGEMLVRQVIDGTKWATCGFKRAYSAEEIELVTAGQGELHAVCSAEDPTPRAIVRVVDVFETPFGSPDPRLVEGEGDGEDYAKFQKDHRVAWEADFADTPLGENEVLVVELFELVSVLDEHVDG